MVENLVNVFQKMPMKAKIEFFFNFCHENCREGLFMDKTVGIFNESKNLSFFPIFVLISVEEACP